MKIKDRHIMAILICGYTSRVTVVSHSLVVHLVSELEDEVLGGFSDPIPRVEGCVEGCC